MSNEKIKKQILSAKYGILFNHIYIYIYINSRIYILASGYIYIYMVPLDLNMHIMKWIAN